MTEKEKEILECVSKIQKFCSRTSCEKCLFYTGDNTYVCKLSLIDELPFDWKI